jgi:hypothetical protein
MSSTSYVASVILLKLIRESMIANMMAESNEGRPGERSNNVKREGRARRVREREGGLNSSPGATGPRPEVPGLRGPHWPAA